MTATIPPVDFTSANGIFDWFFLGFLNQFLGNMGIVVCLIIAVAFMFLMFFNANRFTVFGFMISLMLAFGLYGYTIVGWIAPFAAMLAGLVFAMALIRVIGI